MSAGKPLAKYNAACRAIAAAKSVDEVKAIRNKADGMRAYARQAKDKTLEIDAAEIRIRAERQLGHMIAAQKASIGLAKGAAQKGVGRRGKRGSQRNPHSAISLAELGIGKHLANQARRLAEVSEEDFEAHIGEWRSGIATSNSIVTIKFLRAARWRWREKELAETPPSPRMIRYYLWVDDDSLPETLANYTQKIELLLRENVTAPAGSDLPKNFDRPSKVVADAMWRLYVLCHNMGRAGAERSFIDTMDKMISRLDKLAPYLKALRLAEFGTEVEPQGEET